MFGVEKIAFPPAEKLTDSQALQLVDAIEMLWESRNISPFYPDELPVKLKYTLLVGKWDEEWLFCPSMHSTIEFCDYNPEVCPFGEAYCTCKDLDFGEEPDDLMGDEDFEIPY